MSLTAVFFVGVGLAMDACAVSFAKGISLKKKRKKICLFTGSGFRSLSGTYALIGLVGGHPF